VSPRLVEWLSEMEELDQQTSRPRAPSAATPRRTHFDAESSECRTRLLIVRRQTVNSHWLPSGSAPGNGRRPVLGSSFAVSRTVSQRHLVRASAEHLPFLEKSFDAVVAQLVVHFMTGLMERAASSGTESAATMKVVWSSISDLRTRGSGFAEAACLVTGRDPGALPRS
jgi:hypothetical protein